MPAVASPAQIPERLETLIRRRMGNLKMLPETAVLAMQVAQDPAGTISEFARVVERDVKLATDILAMSNSVFYGPSAPVANLDQAVVRLGLRRCRNLIINSSLTSIMQEMTFGEMEIRERLTEHSFLVATLGLHLNRALQAGFQGEEFTAGLLHDFGRTLLAVALPEVFQEIDHVDFDESPATLQSEQLVLDTDHCEVGAWFAESNQIPAPLVDAIRYHHQPELSTENLRLTALTSACDHMANYLHRTGSSTGYDPRTNTSVRLLEQAGVKNACSRFAEVFTTLMFTAMTEAEKNTPA